VVEFICNFVGHASLERLRQHATEAVEKYSSISRPCPTAIPRKCV
jgi:hypothetical protein